MDKNMIHIDDLVRQRLAGREEDERAGSWLKMRELLDKEMPLTPVANAYNWKRFAGVLAGVLLLSALTFGVYRATESGNPSLQGGDKAAESNMPGNTQHPGNGDQGNHLAAATTGGDEQKNRDHATGVSAAIASQSASANTTARTTATVKNETNAGNTVALEHAAAGRAAQTAAPVASRIATSTAPDHNTDPGTAAGNNSRTAASGVNAHIIGSSNANSVGHIAGTHNASRSSNQNLNTNKPELPETMLPVKEDRITISHSYDHSSRPSAVVEHTDKNGTTRTEMDMAATSNIVSPIHQMIMRKDTIEKISLVHRTVINPVTGARQIVVDTTNIEKLTVIREIPVALVNPVPAKTRGSVAESVPAASSEGAQMELLANHRTSSRKTRAWDPQNFEEIFLKAKYNIAKIQFYGGVNLGAGGSFINGFMPGIQGGLTGNMVFNDRWSMLAELKYNNRFNNGTSVQDNYSQNTDVYDFYIANKLYREFRRDSVSHYFNFSTLGAIELPIMLRYSFSKFFVSGGINLVYNLGVNVEEKFETTHLRDTVAIVTLPMTAPHTDVAQKIFSKDFGSRFGIGYIFGAGYQLSPALNIEARMMQTFWDNARGEGAKSVSKQLFKLPAAQITLGYRFGQRNGH